LIFHLKPERVTMDGVKNDPTRMSEGVDLQVLIS
jgi:hypothetical protein